MVVNVCYEYVILLLCWGVDVGLLLVLVLGLSFFVGLGIVVLVWVLVVLLSGVLSGCWL